MMALMGVVLWAADRRAASAADAREVPLRDALLIGLAQALAIVPGTSRSGATISMALFLGHRRESAARFSFLLALPITLGAALVKVPHLLRASADTGPVAGGHAGGGRSPASWRSASCCAYVRMRDYRPFVYYRFAFAIVVLGLLLVRRAQLG